jgi:hypothetical protein
LSSWYASLVVLIFLLRRHLRVAYLDVVVGLVCLNDPPGYTSGSLLLAGPPLLGRLVVRGQMKKQPVDPPGLLGVDHGAKNPTSSNYNHYETIHASE